MNAMTNKAPKSVVGATDIRVARGDVALERVALTNDQGKVVGQVRAHRVQNRLEVMYKRKQILHGECQAGLRFAQDVEACDVGVRSCMNLDERGSGGGTFINWAMVDAGGSAAMASIRVREALQAIGLATWPLVVWVAVEGRPANEWAQRQGLPGREGVSMLRMGLRSLYQHYEGMGPSHAEQLAAIGC